MSTGTTEAPILLEREGPIAWITFNRPHRLNAMSDDLLAGLDEMMAQLATDDSRVIVIRGNGRAFCAGYDIGAGSAEISDHARGVVEVYDRQADHARRYLRIWDHPKPVIAAVHGFCLAGGSQMVTFCDLTIVAEDAQIGASPSLPLGGGFISPQWSFLVGPRRAKQMSFMAGNRLDGTTAAQWGWANEAVPADQLIDRVREMALEIALTPPDIIHMKKVAVNRALELQGWRSVALMGAETDTVIHQSKAVTVLQGWIHELGLKAAIARFRDGELDKALADGN